MNSLWITILAGGMGKRMQSDLPKVLHVVNGETMIVRILKQVSKLNPEKILVVVGKFRDIIKSTIEQSFISDKIIYVDQPQALGTAHAVKCTLAHFSDKVFTNIILNGDVPMLHFETIKEIYESFQQKNAKFMITTIHLANPTGNGRIIKDENDNFLEIVEEKDCNHEQKKITLVNCGIYLCQSDILTEYIPKIDNRNAQAEYYLTDLVKIYRESTNQRIDLFILPPEKEIEIYNVNTKEQLIHLTNATICKF